MRILTKCRKSGHLLGSIAYVPVPQTGQKTANLGPHYVNGKLLIPNTTAQHKARKASSGLENALRAFDLNMPAPGLEPGLKRF